MTQSIREVADNMGIDFDPEVLHLAEQMEQETASRAKEIAQMWGGRAAAGATAQIVDGQPDTAVEHAAHVAVIRVAAKEHISAAVLW